VIRPWRIGERGLGPRTVPLARQGAVSAEVARFGLAALVALATLALRLPELDRYVTIDESRWVGRSADFGSYLQQRDFDKTFIVGHPGVTTMWLGSFGLGPRQVRDFSYLEGQTDVTRRDGYLDALIAGPSRRDGTDLTRHSTDIDVPTIGGAWASE